MKRRLEQFYNSFGDRGVMFILYALAVVTNALPAVFAELPSVYPDEIGTAGIAAMYSGRNWSGLLGGISVGSGYVQALFYTPLFWVIKNPYAIYKAMLVINALIIGFIPLIVYHLAGKFGVMRVRRKLLIAMCCGVYVAHTINSKFIWNEPLTCLLGWLLALCLFSAWDKNSRSSRAMLSVLEGFLCAVAYAANKRMITVVAAVILTAVIARLVMREKLLNLPVFGITLAASFTVEYFLRRTVEQALWGDVSAELSFSGTANSFFGVFFSHIYAFMTSSVGMGSLAAAIFVVVMFSYISEGIGERQKTLDDGTRVYEPVKHKYSARVTVFALFQFLAAGGAAAVSAFFGSGTVSSSGEVFVRYTDNIAPFAIFLVLVYVFLYGIDLSKPLIGAGLYGYSCICFAVAGYPLSELSERFTYSSLFGLFQNGLTGDGTDNPGMICIIMSSLVFTLYALIIVYISCTRRNRTTLVTGTVFGVLMTATVYASTVYIPRICMQNSERLAPAKDVMEMLYNDSQSPPIVAYEIEPRFASTLQFLAPETRVMMRSSGGHIPESCLLIAENGVHAPFEGGSYDVVGRTDGFTVYAYGDSARDFIRYSSANGKDNAAGAGGVSSSAESQALIG